MKRSDLSAEDLALINTDFGEMDKVAAEHVALANDMYETGFSKLATETADAMDAAAKEAAEAEKVAAEEGLDAESEKVAQDLSKFIERGFFDGLKKLGQERHNNEMHYLMPFVEEKVAAKGAMSAMGKFKGMLSSAGKSVKDYHSSMASSAKKAVTGKGPKGGAISTEKRLSEGGKALAKASPYLAAAGGAGAYAATRKK